MHKVRVTEVGPKKGNGNWDFKWKGDFSMNMLYTLKIFFKEKKQIALLIY